MKVSPLPLKTEVDFHLHMKLYRLGLKLSALGLLFLKAIYLAKSPAILKLRRISQALPSPSSPSPSNHLHILKICMLLTSAFEDEYVFFSGKWNDCV